MGAGKLFQLNLKIFNLNSVKSLSTVITITCFNNAMITLLSSVLSSYICRLKTHLLMHRHEACDVQNNSDGVGVRYFILCIGYIGAWRQQINTR